MLLFKDQLYGLTDDILRVTNVSQRWMNQKLTGNSDKRSGYLEQNKKK